MAVTFHAAFYEGEDEPVDFRIKPKFSGLSNGASNIIVRCNDNEMGYLLTCAHVMYREVNGTVNETDPVTIRPYASTRWIKGKLFKRWYFDEAPDLALVEVNLIELEETFGVKINDSLTIGEIVPGVGNLKGSRSVTRRNRGSFQVSPRTSSRQVPERNPRFKGLFRNNSIMIEEMRPISEATITNGDSGSAVFDQNYTVLYGLLALDDADRNYMNELKMDNLDVIGLIEGVVQ